MIEVFADKPGRLVLNIAQYFQIKNVGIRVDLLDIEDRVKAMQTAGQLRTLNREYQAARIDAAKSGVGVMSYGDYLERYKIKMLYEIAAAARDKR